MTTFLTNCAVAIAMVGMAIAIGLEATLFVVGAK